MARILVVEDEVWVADCYHTWLAAVGHKVRQVNGAQAALDALDAELPDLILLDLLLPLANGVQLLHTMQSHTDLADIPVILCSSALPQHVAAFKSYGVRRAIDKAQLSPRRLQQTVAEVLRHATV
jgi:two-component system response regulator BaeR